MYSSNDLKGKACAIIVRTKWIVEDNKPYMELPHLIIWPPSGKTYVVDHVLSSSVDRATGITEFAVQIGTHTTKIWKRPNGSYYAISRR